MSNKHIHVAAAIIYKDNQFLLSKRQAHQHQGDKWEFPGGKIEQGETNEQALIRELQEEINISATECEDFLTLEYEYPEKTVTLNFLLVTDFDGQPKGNEGQEVAWFDHEEIQTLTFPDANKPVLEKIRVLA